MEPAASHHESRRSTWPARRWRQPPDRLRDRAVREVGPDRDHRAVAAGDQQQRRHQRAAADAGEADEHADAEPERDDQWVHGRGGRPGGGGGARPAEPDSLTRAAARLAIRCARCRECVEPTGPRPRHREGLPRAALPGAGAAAGLRPRRGALPGRHRRIAHTGAGLRRPREAPPRRPARSAGMPPQAGLPRRPVRARRLSPQAVARTMGGAHRADAVRGRASPRRRGLAGVAAHARALPAQRPLGRARHVPGPDRPGRQPVGPAQRVRDTTPCTHPHGA